MSIPRDRTTVDVIRQLLPSALSKPSPGLNFFHDIPRRWTIIAMSPAVVTAYGLTTSGGTKSHDLLLICIAGSRSGLNPELMWFANVRSLNCSVARRWFHDTKSLSVDMAPNSDCLFEDGLIRLFIFQRLASGLRTKLGAAVSIAVVSPGAGSEDGGLASTAWLIRVPRIDSAVPSMVIIARPWKGAVSLVEFLRNITGTAKTVSKRNSLIRNRRFVKAAQSPMTEA